MTKVLFILKRREDYSAEIHNVKGLSTGLFNSASFMDNMLSANGVESVLEVAVDNNCIDRLVTLHKPTHVIIEALWVVPDKFAILSDIHPDVTWIIRLHSDMPFMAGEGMSMDWVGAYSCHPKIVIAPNSPRMYSEMYTYIKSKHHWSDQRTREKVVYLPNYYPLDSKRKKFDKDKYWIDIGCFGAIRPLKNHLIQAVAALEFAEKINKQLRFHINLGRVEGRGEPAMNNLKGMFENLHVKGHRLVGHQWTPHEGFLDICASMDIGMQVSFSETYNIVGADIISQGVPFVGSIGEIPWGVNYYSALPQETSSVVQALARAYCTPQLNVAWHSYNINRYSKKSKAIWLEYFRG